MNTLNIKDILMTILLIILLIGSLFLIFIKGLKNNEKVECEKWHEYSTKYTYWYATDWQIEQCQNYNINLK